MYVSFGSRYPPAFSRLGSVTFSRGAYLYGTLPNSWLMMLSAVMMA